MSDDGKCHICRRTPLRQSRLYSMTTCDDCDLTAAASPRLTAWQRLYCWLGGRW